MLMKNPYIASSIANYFISNKNLDVDFKIEQAFIFPYGIGKIYSRMIDRRNHWSQ